MRLRATFTTVALAVIAGLVAVGLSGCTSTLGYATIVNGTVISQDAINQQLAGIAANTKDVQSILQQGGSVAGSSTGSYSKAFVAIVLDQQISFVVIQQELAARHALPTAAQMATAKTETSSTYGSLFSGFPARYQSVLIADQAEFDAFTKLDTAGLSNAAIKQYYQAHVGDYATEACVSAIVVADKDAQGKLDFAASLAGATKVKAELDAGGDFATLAGGSATNGGEVTGSAPDGCLTGQDLQQYPAAFQQAVVSLPAQQPSDPLQFAGGYVLVEVTKRDSEPLDSNVNTDIHQQVAQEQINELVAKAHVKVNPEFGTFDEQAEPSGEVTGVVPPVVPGLGTTTTTAPQGT